MSHPSSGCAVRPVPNVVTQKVGIHQKANHQRERELDPIKTPLCDMDFTTALKQHYVRVTLVATIDADRAEIPRIRSCRTPRSGNARHSGIRLGDPCCRLRQFGKSAAWRSCGPIRRIGSRCSLLWSASSASVVRREMKHCIRCVLP